MLKALGHPTRLTIVECLSQGPRQAKDVERYASVPQTNVSQHLVVLRSAGLVDFVREGNVRWYYVKRPKLVRDLLRALASKEEPLALSIE